ncbi:MAG: LD-carboxypeptidase [Vampirovibrionales bacterium]|nr:LD-carboxypeptidase [Vampirovibrionales bacterium]
MMRRQFPKALKPQQTVGIISPAYPTLQDAANEDPFQKAEAFLIQAGYHPRWLPNAKKHWRYMAAQDAQRRDDIHAAFLEPEISAIWCARGGYGTMRLLADIDWSLIASHPKLLLGFSDITALQLAAYTKTGLISLYAPMLTSNLINPQEEPETSWQDIARLLNPELCLPYRVPNRASWQCIQPGKAEGILLGGNLSLIASLCGTPYLPDFSGCILFLEDWLESAHSLDRQFQQLRLAGVFDGLAGLLLCDFSQLTASTYAPNLAWPALFEDLTHHLNCPVGLGFSCGHCPAMTTLPQGVLARLDTTTGHLVLLESPVVH